MKRLIIGLMFLLFALCAFPQTDFSAVDSMARGEERIALFGSDGWGGIPANWEDYVSMRENYSDSLLDALARRHYSAAVRATAGRVLIDRNSPLAVPLLVDMLGDTAKISVDQYDVVWPSTVTFFLVQYASVFGLKLPTDTLQAVRDRILNRGDVPARGWFVAVMTYRDRWSKKFINETFTLVNQLPNNAPDARYNNEGGKTYWWKREFKIAYFARRDKRYNSLWRKYNLRKVSTATPQPAMSTM